ncbi:hypothetical protein SAMN05660493_00373 [Epilithonimonas bovis DSM 19482]|uniref:Uncharacterized protein n=1 Tax=Epilithonimonas bovis DSM 19482 TaxID=1121284 RepID=A0A1U7PVC1_9FLAO|nr:hypothetical protein [Epilithonimonas bovis]QIY84988.1 hypothetical protein HER18_16400 [Chryseobacterium sp. NEB161]SIT95718.1 hypothetical protein SAMN05660493_00373 [Epilithonimonas bovis DSM 19482]
MNIESRKIEFVQAFMNLQSEELISQFEKLLKKAKQSEKELNPFTIEELNYRIDVSLEDSKNDKVTESNELLSEIKHW